jgi:hypothetical protein
MKPLRLLLLSLLLFGFCAFSFTSAIYYGWLSVTPGCDASCESRYSMWSTALGYSSYALFLAGFVSAVLALLKKLKGRKREVNTKV